MKTLLECQDEVARKYGYKDFKSAIEDSMKGVFAPYINEDFVKLNNEAAELYAEQYARQKCEEQKCLCLVSFSDAYIHLDAQSQAILNAPSACDNK